MADIRRQVGDIRVTQFINPGVEDTSGAAMLAAVGQSALDIDQKIAENKLERELSNMRTIYETSSFALTGAEAPGGLSQADVQEISRAKDRLGQMSRAVEQGRMSVDMYRVTAEAALRAAIARRPGLASEFRQLASDTLGTDVAGAGIQVLAQAEAAMVQDAKAALRNAGEAEDKAKEEKGKRYRELVELNPTLSARLVRLSDAELVDYLDNTEDPQAQADFLAMQTTSTARAAAETAKLASARTTAEQTATRPTAMIQFQAVKADYDAGVATLAAELGRLTADGLTEEDFPAIQSILNDARTSVRNFQNNLQSARGALGDNFVRAEFDMANDDMQFLDGLLKQPSENAALVVESLKNFATMRANQENPQLVTLGVISREISPDVASAIITQSPEARNSIVAAYGASSIEGAGSKTLMNSASTTIANTTQVLVDSGNKPVSEGVLVLHQKVLTNTLNAFANAETRDYNMREFGGPTGVAYLLANATGTALAGKLTPEQQKEIGDGVVAAASRHLSIARSKFLSENPALRDKVRFELREDGTFIQGTGLTPTEQQAVNRAERQYINGKSILGAATRFGVENPLQAIPSYRAPARTQPASARAAPSPAPQGDIRSVAEELNSIYGGG